jgi:Zinc finger, ZZ type
VTQQAWDFALAVYRDDSCPKEFLPAAISILRIFLPQQSSSEHSTCSQIGVLYWRMGLFDQGQEFFEKAMEMYPRNARFNIADWVQFFVCDDCKQGQEDDGVPGLRYKCEECPDYDLCSYCVPGSHNKNHTLRQIPGDEWLRNKGLVWLRWGYG